VIWVEGIWWVAGGMIFENGSSINVEKSESVKDSGRWMG
jgi:hypothetical protein